MKRFALAALMLCAGGLAQAEPALDDTGVERTLAETVTGLYPGRIDIAADTVDIDVNLDGARYGAFRDLAMFLLENMHKPHLDTDEAERLKTLLRASIPVFDGLEESLSASNVTVGTVQGTFGAEAVYGALDLSGGADAARLGLAVDVARPRLPAGMLPPAAEDIVPGRITVNAAATPLDLAAAARYLIDNADFTRRGGLTAAQRRELGGIVLPEGRMTVDFERVVLVSPVYDVALSGRMTVYPEEKGRHSARISITARDIDGTIAFLRRNAGGVPRFGQAAFLLLMAKGFAETRDDGSRHWDLAMEDGGGVVVNGRPFPFGR